jgi:hypothetical protein
MFVLDTEKFRFIIYIWYEGGGLTPFLVTGEATSADIG